MAGTRAQFTHFDAAGQAQMVDVGGKDVSKRVARAGGRILMQPDTLALIREGRASIGGEPSPGRKTRPWPSRPTITANSLSACATR